MHRMRGFTVALFTLSTLVIRGSTYASIEPETGDITGRLMDERGAAIPSGGVHLEGPERWTISDGSGAFHFLDVPAGRYRLAVQVSGYQPLGQDSVRVEPGRTTSIDIRFKETVAHFATLEIKGTRGPTPRGPEPRRDFQADSSSIYGAWRWLRTYGGLTPAREEPPPTGWYRELYFRNDGTYSFWEVDSVGSMPLCSGRFGIHRAGRSMVPHGGRAALWVDLDGWWWKGDQQQLVAFATDTMITYPGSEPPLTIVDDALTTEYRKEPGRIVPSGSGSPNGFRVYDLRPPRLQRSTPDTYSLEMSGRYYETRAREGSLFQWQDIQFPVSVLKSYRYTNQQVPSAVIGDFDGDSLSDAVVYGTNEQGRTSKILCVLSNRGKPMAYSILGEPTLLDPPTPGDSSPTKWREPRPALYLSLYAAGQRVQTAGGLRKLRNDALLVSRIGGRRDIYYWDKGKFRTAKVPPSARRREK